MFSVLLYALYYVGFKKQAIDLAVKWYATQPYESKKSNAGGAFIAHQKKYEVCAYCTWPIYPNDPHSYCDEQLRTEEDAWFLTEQAELAREEAEWLQFVEDEEAKLAQQQLDEEEWMFDNNFDEDHQDDESPGMGGQPA